MYNQTNYTAQYGQGGPRTPMPQFQQPPPPPSHFQQGPPVLHPSLLQHGAPLPPRVDHSGPPQYHHPPHHPAQQGPPIQASTNRMLFPGQSYLPPPPPPPQQVHGNTTTVHSYSSGQPNSHWSYGVHHAPPAASPATSTEPNPQVLFHPSLPPRILPPLPTHGQSPYSGHIHLPQAGGLHGAQQLPLPPPPLPPPPPPPPSTGPMPPPNPPSSPPPPPPPSPPPTSPYSSAETPRNVPNAGTSNIFSYSEPGQTSGDSSFKRGDSDTEARASVSVQNTNDEPSLRDKSFSCPTSLGSPSSVRDGSSTVEARNFDLSSPPEKPEEVVRNIEVTKGPGFEDMAYQITAGINLPYDSDMDMEDDMTQSEEKEEVYASSVSLDHEIISKPEELGNLPQNPAVQNTGKESPVKKTASESPEVAGKDQDGNHLTDESSIPKVVDSSRADEFPSNTNIPQPLVTPLVSLDQFHSSEAAAGIGSEKLSGELTKETSSPFRLLQDYASDNDSGDNEKPCHEKGSGIAVSPSSAVAVSRSHEDIGSNLPTGKTSDSTAACPQSMPPGAPDVSDPARMVVEPNIVCDRIIETEEPSGNNYKNVKPTANSATDESSQKKYGLDGSHDFVPEVDESRSPQEDGIHKSIQNVDEFGRLVREGNNDSDSDESHNAGRRSKRRRSWSRSRSPHERRSNSSRRKERRSRSRSRSPRRRRSRSRSPIYKRAVEFGGDRMKRDRGQLLQCLDFLRGRCYRGASCRYMHPDSDRSAKSYRSRERHAEARSTVFHDYDVGGKPSRKATYERAEATDGKLDENDYLFSQKNNEKALISGQYDKSSVAKAAESEAFIEVPVTSQQNQDSREETPVSVIGQPRNISSSPLFTSVGVPPSVDETSANDSLRQVHTFRNHLSDGNKQPYIQRSPDPSSITQLASSEALNTSNLPMDTSSTLHQETPLPLISGSTSAPPPPEVSREPNLAQSHSLLAPLEENGRRSEGSLQNQNTHLAVPPNTSWSLPLPPPPPLPLPPRPMFANDPFGMQGRNESTSQAFVRPYPPVVHAHSRPGEFQRSSHHVVQAHESSLHPPNTDYLRPGPQLMSNTEGRQPFGATDFGSDDRLSRFQGPNVYSTNRFSHGKVPPESVPPLGELAQRPQSFPGDNPSSVGIFSSLPHNQPYLQRQPHVVQPPPPYLQPPQQRTPYDLQQSAASGLISDQINHGMGNSALSSYASTYDQNNASHLSSFGGSRVPGHYNPYASTFDQPLASKFSSVSFKQETKIPFANQHDAPYSLGHIPAEGHGGGSLDSKLMVSSPKPARADSSRGDQYDPLFDSMEPSSNSVRKSDKGQKSEPTSGSMPLRLGVSHKLLDMEENSKQKDVGIVADSSSVKSESDQYGETADAEVGDVDNASGSNQFDAENTAAGDIEIDQVKTPGKKGKKSKSSRSTKLFKVALADFVKEELKPFWRQGNMSKEAFKTIVKKTVDKVSGAMKSHQVPKSQTKINQYIDSSQRKLTKLVMGYVQKYVNM